MTPLMTLAAETIAAVATAPGCGGVGIVRVSGVNAHAILKTVFRPASSSFTAFEPWKLVRGHVLDAQGRALDDALAVFMPGPRTFTGEDVVELHCHGGAALLAAVLDEVVAAGAGRAGRGEFTRRAFCNGRMDLSQAEAVAELIAAPTREGVRLAVGKLSGLLGQRMTTLREGLENLRARLCVAVDFPDDEVDPLDPQDFIAAVERTVADVDRLLAGVERTRCWREGVTVALSGPVNAGKSSLMNALLGHERAIVTAHPGTTRDFLEEPVNLAGLPARLVDTAGLRQLVDTAGLRQIAETTGGQPTTAFASENSGGPDPIEAEGIRLGQSRVAAADVVLLVTDGKVGEVPPSAHLDPARVVLVWNKADVHLPHVERHADWFSRPAVARVCVSARTGEGLDELARVARDTALTAMGAAEPDADDIAPNARQAEALTTARTALCALVVDVTGGLPYELCSIRLQEAAEALGNVVGLDSADDVLNRIFDSFCIGK